MIRRAFDAVGRHPVLLVFSLALLVRVGVFVFVNQLPAGTFALDDSTYSQMASDVAQQSRGLWDPYTHQLYRATFAFVAPLALIYSVFGSASVAGQLLVATIGASVAALVAFLASHAMARRWAMTAGMAVALLPSQVLWSSLLLKDPSVWLGLAGLAVVAAAAARTTSVDHLCLLGLAAAGALFYLAFLREHTLVVAAWSLPLAMIFSTGALRLQRIGVALLLMMTVPWVVGIGPGGFTLITNAGSLESRRALNAQAAASAFVNDEPAAVPKDTLETQALRGDISLKQQMIAEMERRAQELEQEAGAGAGSAGREARSLKKELKELRVTVAAEEARLKELVRTSDTGHMEETESLDPDLVHLPKGLFVMLFEPVPWATEGSTTMRMARLESIIWYPLLGLAALGLVQARRLLWALAFPILVGGGMLFVYALTEGNVGTAYRHRGEFVWVVCLLAGLGASQVATWRTGRQPETEEER